MKRAAILAGVTVLASCATAPRPAATAKPAEMAGIDARIGPEKASLLFVADARAAIDRRDGDAAVRLAELAVSAAPGDEARATLARAYAVAGRFDMALGAWETILAAAPRDGAAQLGRALALLGGGQVPAAIAVLDNSHVAPADRGLAYALAGDPRGLPLLEAAAAEPKASARTRQNLALAHAIAGHWPQARALAAADVPPDVLPQRLADWGRIAWAAPAARVALLIGAPVIAKPVIVAPPTVSAPLPKPMLTSLAAATPSKAGWVVQVGAYRSAAEADSAWTRIGALAPVKGRAVARQTFNDFLRVSVAHYGDRLSAQRLCVRIKDAGGDCFVRFAGGQTA